MTNAAEEDWRVLTSLFPEGWQQQARLTGAMERQRGVAAPEALLRLLLLHVARGYSLRETSVRARETGLAQISDVALLKRLRRAEDWLHWLCQQLILDHGVEMPNESREPRRVRILDGTIVREPGKTGSQWRILYSLSLPDLRCDYFDLTAAAGAGTGESLKRLPVARHDLILADAGYGSSAGIRWVVGQGGDVLVRLSSLLPPLQAEAGGRLDLLAHLRQLQTPGQIGEWNVRLTGMAHPARVCALRKSEEATQRAQRRLAHLASKKQTKTRPETREYAQYVVVFTTDLSGAKETILAWYRVRWQIELAFKRLKSLAQLGHLPKHDPQSSRAWLYGKLLVALLTQKLVRTGRELSPWGYLLPTPAATQ